MRPVAAIRTISGAATKFAFRSLESPTKSARVAAFDGTSGIFSLDAPLPQPLQLGTRYELASDEDAPLLAIRLVLGLSLDQRLPPLFPSNSAPRAALMLCLTRTGARTAFVTTRGFGDVLAIANQDRPRLFDLAIQKPEPLFAAVVEIDERIDAFGNRAAGASTRKKSASR